MALLLFYLLNVVAAFGVLIVTYLEFDRYLLAKTTIENGPYEIATALVMLVGTGWLGWRAWRNRQRPGVCLAAAAMAALCFLGAGEEISWGQHWLQFESTDFFKTYNHQKEANLHNLIPAVVFSTLINVVLYSLFTLLPLIHWAYPNNLLSQWLQHRRLALWIPAKSIALMMMLASCFHAWLIPATYSDTAVLIACWLLAAFLMLKKPTHGNTPTDWIMLLMVLAGFGICIWVADIFRHHNMQYEIRECFTAYVVVFWALQWSTPQRT